MLIGTVSACVAAAGENAWQQAADAQTGVTDKSALWPWDEHLAAAVRAAAETQWDQQQLVGLSYGIVEHGKVVATEALGWADREEQVPLTPQHLIRWASISKTITATAVGQLVAAKKLDWDDDVRQWVPEFPDHGAVIRVRDVLCHQSGIVHYANGKIVRTERDYSDPHPFQNVIFALDKFKDSPLVAAPRSKYSYSTHAYILLSAVVERAAGQPFAEYVRQQIAGPAALNSLQPDYEWVEIPQRAVGYRRRFTEIQRSSNTDVSWKLGGGGFISSTEDLAGFAAALLGDQLLTAELKAEMWQRQRTADGQETSAGLGFFVDGAGDQVRISHSGSQEKAKTFLLIYPQQNRGLVVMSNTEFAEPGRIATALDNAWQAAGRKRRDK